MMKCVPLRVGPLFWAALILVAGLAGPLRAEKYLNRIVTVHFLEKGRKPLTGTVVDEVVDEVEGQKIRIQLPAGLVWISFDRIERIEVRKAAAEEFKDRARLCKTAGDWVKLARWCGQPDVRLPQERKLCLEEAIKLDPDHQEARKERGEAKLDGKWVLEDDYYRAKDLVKAEDGSWATPKEAARISAAMKGLQSGLRERERQDKGVPWAEARTLKSTNYVLKCNSTLGVAQRYLKVLEALHRAYSDVLKGFDPLYTGPSTVYVFRNREEFLEFTLTFQGVGGYFSGTDRCVRAYHGSFGPSGNTDMVLAHEATHQFQHRIIKGMLFWPTWLIEGMAVYFGDGTKIKPEKVQLNEIPRDRLHSLKEAINTKRYMPLKRLLVQLRAPQAYDHGWGVIFWCLQGHNPKYKFGHKGEGKRIWDQYLQHVVSSATDARPERGHLEQEAKYFCDLILKETGAPSIEKWEEGYKNFILALPLEPLGKWSGKQWDSWNQLGIRFTIPDRFTSVKEDDLRQAFREAAAAATDDGVRLWLYADAHMAQRAQDLLQFFMAGTFVEREPDEEFKDEESKMIKVNDVFDVAVTAFRGKYVKRRESSIPTGGDPKKGSPAGKKEKKAALKPQAKPAPTPLALNRVRLALFTTSDRFYVFCLSGPEAPFSKVEPKFEEILNSVKLNYALR